MILRPLFLAALLTAAPLPVLAQSAAVKAVHQGLLVMDTHFDTPALFGRSGWNMMDRHSVAQDGSRVDYPRMVEGGVDGGFFAVFISQGPRTPEGNAAARDAGLVRIGEIREMVARNNRQFTLAYSAEEAEAAVKAHKRFVLISMENGYPLGKDISLLRTFHSLGLRVAGLVHFRNNELGDSASDKPEWNGLSPLGKEFVAEANRLGILLDASHSSDQVFDQMLELSRAPIILSHSGVRAVYNHPRNLDDVRLRALAAHGGVIQINAYAAYMGDVPEIAARSAALAELAKRLPGRSRTEADAIALQNARAEIDRKWPLPRASIDDVVQHIQHAVQVAGIDHVGLSGDFDGGGGVEGLDDVTDYPRLTGKLMAVGFTAEDLAKFWGGNALRVLRQAQAMAER